jgi:hypothetical protein
VTRASRQVFFHGSPDYEFRLVDYAATIRHDSICRFPVPRTPTLAVSALTLRDVLCSLEWSPGSRQTETLWPALVLGVPPSGLQLMLLRVWPRHASGMVTSSLNGVDRPFFAMTFTSRSLRPKSVTQPPRASTRIPPSCPGHRPPPEHPSRPGRALPGGEPAAQAGRPQRPRPAALAQVWPRRRRRACDMCAADAIEPCQCQGRLDEHHDVKIFTQDMLTFIASTPPCLAMLYCTIQASQMSHP